MKIHTINKEYCKCKRHSRKFKKFLKKFSENLIRTLDEIK